ncbi:hypothetical protein TWF106_005267 [Orbilia oligospora]|uniref:Uncharacterized protein n=1 Tax=Orbilia oligospora TaxID=2813651 RepID=A0A6G1MN15_ORBOL|nr:hypothetical protein TWF788_000400 [Orbilia oligospora]KAF3202504.1 hypothetical protein TWF679_010751 [Orbilia oligospora]KAF3202789.1 hypothetical protein TWF191_002879 [Orbilia oligospora]KAF3222833.1 hypothetical protein TWF106_005267 [Orbilia oligospora]KAF3263595.1 hypothetical protein TWF192_005872 [Orbilia oligospora]
MMRDEAEGIGQRNQTGEIGFRDRSFIRFLEIDLSYTTAAARCASGVVSTKSGLVILLTSFFLLSVPYTCYTYYTSGCLLLSSIFAIEKDRLRTDKDLGRPPTILHYYYPD